MFSREKSAPGAVAKPARSGPPGLSFIGPEVVVSGDLTTTAQLHVDGRVEGDVRCAQLCQGANGAIAGHIVAEEARIAGLVEGTVAARTLVLEASARVTADVSYETITIAAGARIDGRLARREGAADGAAAMLVATPTEPPAADPRELFPAGHRPRAAAG